MKFTTAKLLLIAVAFMVGYWFTQALLGLLDDINVPPNTFFLTPSSLVASKPYKPIFNVATKKREAPEIRLLNSDKKGVCSGVVISSNYALTAAHCLSDVAKLYSANSRLLSMLSDQATYYVQNASGTVTVSVKIIAFNDKYDVAALEGDFSDFNWAAVDFKGELKLNSASSFAVDGSLPTAIFVCGFKRAQVYTCQQGSYTGVMMAWESQFYAANIDELWFGMSGGPSYAITTSMIPVVIGLNTGMHPQANGKMIGLIAPIFGVDKVLWP